MSILFARFVLSVATTIVLFTPFLLISRKPPLMLLLIIWVLIFGCWEDILDKIKPIRSRKNCQTTFILLHRHFGNHSLEGLENMYTMVLLKRLEEKIGRHVTRHPSEDRNKQVLIWYRYTKKLREIKTLTPD